MGKNRSDATVFDRRHFLGGSAAMLLAPSAMAENAPPKLSGLIAQFVTRFDLKNVPPAAIERARVVFVDTIGVMLAGSQQEVAAIVADMVRAEGGNPTASVVGQSLRTTPQLAALANGVASHALDYDFTYLQGQLAAPLIPSLLPLAEANDATQDELLAAFMVGFEVCSRLGRANPDHNSHGSWHGTGTIGAIAAAAGASRMLKAPASTIADIIGISVSTAAGVNANYGTMTKPLHAGMAARNGITAAMLGMRGFTANAAAIEGRGGFAATFARALEWHPEVFQDLGRSFDLVEREVKLKRYPCGGVTHTSIDIALGLRDSLAARLADIARVRIGTTKYAANRAGEQYPASTESAKFHIPYLVAYTLIRGAPNLASFTPEAIGDERIKALAQKVTTHIDPEFAEVSDASPSRIRIEFASGKPVEEVRYFPSGTRQFPMSDAQIRAKFLDCAALAVDRNTAEKLLAMLGSLGDQSSLKDLWPLLRRA